ncbi:DUF2304 domain-containing protein [Coprobacillus sp. AM09-26]|jgi:hypothetical protein|uniref:DUF2304 domain-containing protein n=1 Tax=Faecalibacillus intestinalis TaxID=1982626 RepID=UPI000E4283AC|nr:DUF2304 domain-containing protein [Faecalibacillus intestinalis]RGF24510.1 DUF2304 domain-containing protein [Coprobacillus sp. AM09-26]
MSLGTIITVVATGLLLLFIILFLLKRGRIPVKFALLWIFISVILLLVGLFPEIISSVAGLFGFKTMSNMLIGILISMLIFITIALTIIVSGQKYRITLLTQELSMLKEKVNSLENK